MSKCVPATGVFSSPSVRQLCVGNTYTISQAKFFKFDPYFGENTYTVQYSAAGWRPVRYPVYGTRNLGSEADAQTHA
jgi:hypothetical protein